MQKELLVKGQHHLNLQDDLTCRTITNKLPFTCGIYLISNLTKGILKIILEIFRVICFK